jgi:histidine triad (HIT) family protein
VARDDCVFCRIIRGEAPGYKVHEDDLTVTIMDASPASEGHVLVLTREHHENIHEVPRDTLCAVAAVSKRMAHAIREVFEPDGIGVYQLNGPAAGQSVFHYHMHVIPRHEGQKRSVHGRARGEDADLADAARRIIEALDHFDQ